MPEKIVTLVVFRPTCGEGGRPIFCINGVEVPKASKPSTEKEATAPKVSAYEILRDISDTDSAR